ncbi:uncharacterized protein LOC131952327 [Physella acuta]|uniref:uncharacterized protein LOC131952327 n=1 Tax=Physella acuta TaxID=109671 RepID=UPI0027DD2546|nr:uncharacterized protein LOC131952327 [Physella acuta]
MVFYLSRVVLVVMTTLAGITWADFTCVPPPTRAGVSPARPSILESMNDFQARIEVNVLDKNYSMVVDEYLDYTGNRGALVAYRQGVKEMVLYSYVTGEVFHVNLADKSCVTKNISDDSNSFIFGPFSLGNPGDPQKHIFSSAQALKFAANANDIYLGTKNVRGIPADVWTTCLPWPSVSGQVNATFYFSVPGWNVSGPIQQVPLRIEVEGDSDVAQYGVTLGTTLAPGSKRHFHHIYDFIAATPPYLR